MSDESRFQEALRTPSDVYRKPDAVVRDAALSREQKLEILEHWEAEAIELQESEGEGMGGGERSLLTEIKDAIKQLKEG